MKFDYANKNDVEKKVKLKNKKEFVTSNNIASDYYSKLQKSIEELENYHCRKDNLMENPKSSLKSIPKSSIW